MKNFFIFCFLFQTIIIGQNISALLPDSVEGWKALDIQKVYIGEDLYKLIDGGADIFYEYGFKQVGTQRYINNIDKIISVEIYEMIDSSASFGIFSLFTFKTGKQIKFGSGASEGDEFLIFWKGNYYITLSGYDSSEETKKGIFLTAESIESKIKSTGMPLLINTFYQHGYPKAVYLKGNLGLYNLTNITIGRNFKIEEAVCLEKEETINFIFKYKNEEESKNNFASLITEFKNNPSHSFVTSDSTSLVFKDEENNYYYISRQQNYIIISSAKFITMISSVTEAIKNLLIY